MWYDATQIYRKWALKNARWLKYGKIRNRPDIYPEWFLKTHLWFNSGWSCDIRNLDDKSGDPDVLAELALNLKNRLNLTGFNV